MEAILALFLPLALLWAAFALATGRSIAPNAAAKTMTTWLWKGLRWLWKERPQRSGAGRLRQPRVRYRLRR